MFTKFKVLSLSLGMLLFISGCGDLLGSKTVKKEMGSGQFEANCELDMNAFSNILRKNISSQIRCLGENLNLFIKIVKSGKPGYLSRVQLEHYLATRPDVKPELIKMLGSVFELGHLITGEDPNYISKAVVEKVINFALVFNQEAALNFSPIFENKTPVTYALHLSHREIVSGANKAIIQSLRAIFNSNRGGEIHKINIVDLLENFKTEENAESIDNAKKVLFAKKLVVGGDPEYLTHTELEKIILNFDHFVLITLDAVRYKYIILKEQGSLLQFLKRNVDDLYKIVLQGGLHSSQDDSKTLFSLDQVLDALKVFISKDNFDIDKFRVLIEEAKTLLMTGNTEEIKVGEFKKLFGHAQSILQSGTVFHRIYDKFRVDLESYKPVTIDFSEYRHTYPEHQKELDQFERIVKKYRFMKGEFLSPYYGRAYRRNANGIFEIALLEYALKLVFVKYGSPSPNADAVGGYSIDATQVENLILKFEDVLIDMDILTPQKAISTANNISLLGSLFQYQSDKNKVMDINEGTEFALTLLSAIPMSDEIFASMKADPTCRVDEFDRVDPDCFKNNYWKALCDGYKNYYPLLFEYLGPQKCSAWVNSSENILFLNKLSDAARTCNYYDESKTEEIAYSKSDVMNILVAMTHVETTILRWDINNNNFMDASEVNSAYEIYSPALDGFLEDQSAIIKKFKKQIFQFLVKYEEIPDPKEFKSIWKFIKFLLKFDKKSPASRKTIASILVAIGEQNKKQATGPQFDCQLMRDPTNIPRTAPTAPSTNKSKKTKAVDNRTDYSYLLQPYLHIAD